MVKGRRVLALIPARSGSKGIHGKNVAELAGRKLIDYTLDAAINAQRVDEVWVSSDDHYILSLAAERGANQLRRPARFAGDDATAMQVVDHWLSSLDEDIVASDPLVVYLQPTSPLRCAKHIDESLDLLERFEANSLLSVVKMEKSPFKAFTLDSTGRLISLFDEKLSNQRRQDLPIAYLPNGAIYIFTVSAYRDRGGFPSNGSVPYKMSIEESIDIDTASDLEAASSLLELRHE